MIDWPMRGSEREGMRGGDAETFLNHRWIKDAADCLVFDVGAVVATGLVVVVAFFPVTLGWSDFVALALAFEGVAAPVVVSVASGPHAGDPSNTSKSHRSRGRRLSLQQ